MADEEIRRKNREEKSKKKKEYKSEIESRLSRDNEIEKVDEDEDEEEEELMRRVIELMEEEDSLKREIELLHEQRRSMEESIRRQIERFFTREYIEEFMSREKEFVNWAVKWTFYKRQRLYTMEEYQSKETELAQQTLDDLLTTIPTATSTHYSSYLFAIFFEFVLIWLYSFLRK